MKGNQTITISTSTFFKAVLIFLGLWFLWFIRDIVAIFVVALLLSALIDPFADWFAKRRIPRGLSVLIVYTILLSIVSVILILFTPIVAKQSVQLISNVQEYYGDLSESFGYLPAFSDAGTFGQNLQTSLESFQQGISSSFGYIFSTVKGFLGSIAAFLIILVLTFYLVVEGDKVRTYFKNLAPVEYQPYISQLLEKMQNKIGAWLRGQLLLGLVVGVMVYIGLTLLGIKYALLLALIAGLFEIVPYIGPIMALIPALIIGFAQAPIDGVAVLVLYTLVQQVENNVLVPKIMQKVTGLNPIISIAALLIGIKVAGLVGAILSIPLATMLAVVLDDFFKELV